MAQPPRAGIGMGVTVMPMTTATAIATAPIMTTATRTATTTRMTTGTDAALPHLLWLASPALPVGAFSYSEGLEAAVDDVIVHDEASAQAWLLNQLELVQARSELPLIAQAWRACERGDAEGLAAANAWVLQTRESAELLQQTTQMGRSLLAWMRGQGLPTQLVEPLHPPTWPVAFAAAAQARQAPLAATLQAAAFGWSENLCMAAVRAVPLGQSAGQRILGALAEAIPDAVDAALALPDGERLAALPGLAILGARHETQYSRLFRS